MQKSPDEELLMHLYNGFNARDMEAVLAKTHPEVVWANGMDGGYVYGRDSVRNYWTRQWAIIDPRVQPTGFSSGAGGGTEGEVHQTVRALQANGVIARMEGLFFRVR